jgi:dihydroorotase
MEFTKLTEIELPAAFDAHVHLRDGEMSQLVTPTIRKGGVNQVYVMVSPWRLSYYTSTHHFQSLVHLCHTISFYLLLVSLRRLALPILFVLFFITKYW